MSDTRIYLVKLTVIEDAKVSRLVEASTPAQALRHVVKDLAECSVATTKEVAELVKAGAEVETA